MIEKNNPLPLDGGGKGRRRAIATFVPQGRTSCRQAALATARWG